MAGSQESAGRAGRAAQDAPPGRGNGPGRRQPRAGPAEPPPARRAESSAGGTVPPPDSSGQPQNAGQPRNAGQGPGQALPPGQYIPRTLPVLHYGPVPAFHPETWYLRIFGATESGADARLRWEDVEGLPVSQVTADFHCVTKFTVPGVCWTGIPATEILQRFPPEPAVTHVMVWADFGYSANIRIGDFVSEATLLATHRGDERLSPEHGFPLRIVVPHLYAWKSVKWIRAIEYLTADRRGFWEERGYHNTADPWREQRYSYQEVPGEGPPL